MPFLLLLIPAALAVPKAFSDTVVLLAVAPDAHRVLLGTLGSFEDQPRACFERDVRSGAQRALSPEVETAFASCAYDAPCPALDAAWVPGAWIAWSNPPVPARWTVVAAGEGAWVTTLAASCTNEGTIFTPCEADRGADHVALVAREPELRVSLVVGGHERAARFSPRRLTRLGVPDLSGLVLWGEDGVLVAFPGAWAAEGEALPPVMAFVLPTR